MGNQETDKLAESLTETGCEREFALRIASLEQNGNYAEAVRLMRSVRCRLVEDMHESQRKVDRMDCLIRYQENKMKEEKRK